MDKCAFPNCSNEKYLRKSSNTYSDFCKKHIKSTTSKFFYIHKYGKEQGEIEFNKHKKSHDCGSISYFIKKYGEIQGKEKWEEKNKKISVNNSLDLYVKKYGEIQGKEKWEEKNKKLSFTLDNLILKYGEIEGKKKWNNYICKQKNYSNEKRKNKSIKNSYINSINFYIDKYGEIEGKEKYEKWKKSQDHSSLDFFIKKYGEIEGNNKYKEVCKKKATNNLTYFSNISQKLFDNISSKLNIKSECIYATNNKREFNIKTIDGKFFYDFKFKNKIIEYNGDMWHANPKIYSEDNCPRFDNVIAKNIWAYDKIKQQHAINKGYDILIIWHSDYVNDKKKIEKICIDFLNDSKNKK